MEALSRMPPEARKQHIGERLFPLVRSVQPDLAGRITGMLLEMDNGELLELLADPFKVVQKAAQAVHVLLLHRAVPDGCRLQGFDVAVEKHLPAAKRPIICESSLLATMPHEERKQLMERRLFAAVAQLQPLAPWLVFAALAAELDLEHCFSLTALSAQAKTALRYLDNPGELAAAVNRIVGDGDALTEQYNTNLPTGHALRSEADVLEAAAHLLPEGNSLPWLPARHGRFPPAFRSATQALLLCKYRARALVAAAAAADGAAAGRGEAQGAPAAGGGSPATAAPVVPPAAAVLDSLPDELVQPILGMAAHPLDEWYSAHV